MHVLFVSLTYQLFLKLSNTPCSFETHKPEKASGPANYPCSNIFAFQFSSSIIWSLAATLNTTDTIFAVVCSRFSKPSYRIGLNKSMHLELKHQYFAWKFSMSLYACCCKNLRKTKKTNICTCVLIIKSC